MKHKKISVILCGSGFKDGSEIRESVSVLLALSQQGAEFQCFAPDDYQTDVINCLNGTQLDEKRNMLVEAARIARGNVRPIHELKVEDFDGIIVPGGFGAAKNLCNFAFKGAEGSARADVQTVLKSFKDAKKPIGAVCIAPAIVALVFKGEGLELTVGDDAETAGEIKKLGHNHKVCPAHECVVDSKNLIITTPAYMYDSASLADIFRGISELVSKVLSL